MADLKIFGGDSDLIKTRLHGLTQDAYIVTEEKVSSFNNYSHEFQISITLFSIFFGATLSIIPSYKVSTTNTIIFYVCLVLTVLTSFFLLWSRHKFNKIKGNLFIKAESIEYQQNNSLLQVLKVRYGTPKKTIDITDRIIKKVKDNKLSFVVSNEVAGDDPQQGIRKNLDIEYSFRSVPFTKNYIEGDMVNLP